ncbi:MAG: flagellar assembly protein FliW [Deferribacterales bacterium]
MKGNAQLQKKAIEKKELFSLKYGKIEYSEKDLIYMTNPIPGFINLYDYIVISTEENIPFYVFHSTEDPSVSFIIVDIKLFFPDYNPNLHKRDLKILQAKSEKDLKLFGIVVVPSNPKEATVNLKAPLVINFEKKLAKQIILEDDRYEIKTPLFKE